MKPFDYKKIIEYLKIGGRLRNKIFRMTVLVAVVPLFIGGVLALYVIDLSHRHDVAGVEDNLVLRHVDEVNNFIQEIVSIFQLQVSYEQLSEIEISQQHFLLERLLEENSSLVEVSFLNLSGKETSRRNRFYPRGVDDDELTDQSQIEKFIKAKSGKDYIGPVNFSLQGPLVTIASPVVNRNNQIVSVLAGEINLTAIQKTFQKARLGSIGYLYLTDQEGRLLAHSQEEKLTSANVSDAGIVSDVLAGKSFLGLDGQSNYKSFWNEKVVAASAPVELLGWAVVAEWPLQDANATFNTIRNQLLVFLMLALIFAIIVSIFLTNKIVRPIKVLEEGTALVAKGKFDQPITIKTNDEIEDLGQAFNKMMKGLKRLEELKEEFVFIAAHELRTPVTAIKGYISMVLDDPKLGKIDEKAKEFLGEVSKASDRLNQLVNDLLQIARSEAGRLEIKVASTDITEPIKQVLSELKPLADEKSIKLIYEPGTPLPNVMADPIRLKEVMVNLVGNAIKYTLGAGTVTISHEIKEKELITHVVDTGVGMSKESQKKLFEKFYRVQTKKTREITGTGLGLFIVKEIIEKMKGKVWATSEEGKGSTFSFGLPLAP